MLTAFVSTAHDSAVMNIEPALIIIDIGSAERCNPSRAAADLVFWGRNRGDTLLGERRLDMASAVEVLPDGREIGPVATRVLFENERVRIWEMKLAPGESTALHRHALDYVQVEIAGDKISGLIEPGAGGTYRETFEMDVKPGAHFWVERGGFETAKNTGKKPYHGVLIELKEPRLNERS
jgi:beta-alanine degradation protein BauB